MGDILLSIGLTTIEKSMTDLVTGLRTNPQLAQFNGIQSIASSIALLLALCVGSYECWMMMLGRHGLDVMKLLRIVGISICISVCPSICEALRYPGDVLSTQAKYLVDSQSSQIETLEKDVKKRQEVYLDSLDAKRKQLYEAEAKARAGQDQSAWEATLDALNPHLIDKALDCLDKIGATVMMNVIEFFNTAVRFIGEVVFQLSYYGMLLGANIFLCILGFFAPLNFALSLAPPFKAAWSQWVSKYLTISLWPFVTYMIVYFVMQIMKYTLELDYEAYGIIKPDESALKVFSMQGIGTTIYYVVAVLMGAFLLRMVPEVASWLIPAGQSSGFGSMSASVSQHGAYKGGMTGAKATYNGGKTVVKKILGR